MLTFIYSTVNAGKTANLLMRAHSCTQREIPFQILVPSVVASRDGTAQVSSRIGFSHEAISLKKDECPFEAYIKSIMSGKCSKVIFVDEAQFLTKEQVLGLTRIVDEMNIPVFAYGLRSDFQGNPFEGAVFLMTWADKIEEIATFALGGGKAIFNQKLNEKGERVTEGEVVDAGFHYIPVTRSDFKLNSHWKK